MALPNPNLQDYDFSGSVPYLFGRSWSVLLGSPGGTGLEFASSKGTGLRTSFDIMRTSDSSSNKSKIELYNLSGKSRSTYLKGGQLTLQVGYGKLLETLFVGTFIKAVSARKGPEIVTTFELGDAEFELYSNYINRSYPAGTQLVQVVQDLIAALGLPLGTVSGLSNTVFNNGFVATGSVKDLLDRELRKQNLEWSVQNGVVQIIPISQHNGEEAVVVNSDTGMVGVPNKSLTEDNVVSFTSLINPKLVPGVPVLLQSSSTEIGPLDQATGLYSGVFKVRTAHFEGDTHEVSKWQVTCECDPLSGFAPVPNQNKGGRIVA